MGRGAWKRGQIQQSATRWQSGYTSAGPALTAGVANPSADPTAAAIAQVGTMVSNFNTALAGGAQSQWANNLRRAGLAGWQAGMNAYASTGLASKASKGAPHFLLFAQQYAPAVLAAAAALPPPGDFAANQARAAAMSTWEHNQRGKYKHLWT